MFFQDGAATVEKSGVAGSANIIGANLNVPVKALPAHAQLALQKNQKNNFANEEDFEEEEDEYDEEELAEAPRQYQLGAYVKVTIEHIFSVSSGIC